MSIFTIRAGDRLPWLAYDFGFSLVGALGVTFSARVKGNAVPFINGLAAIIGNGTYTINGASVVLTPASGVVFYPWGVFDTAIPRKGVLGLFHITWAGNLQETIPSDGEVEILIKENF